MIVFQPYPVNPPPKQPGTSSLACLRKQIWLLSAHCESEVQDPSHLSNGALAKDRGIGSLAGGIVVGISEVGGSVGISVVGGSVGIWEVGLLVVGLSDVGDGVGGGT